MAKIGWIVVLLIASSSAVASEELYICQALSVLELGDDGALAHSDFAKAIAMHQSEFAVDRKSGVVAGAHLRQLTRKMCKS